MTERVVVITGAAGGIGQSLCRHFIDAGDIVVAFDRAGALDALQAFDPRRLTAMAVDVTDEAALQTAVERIGERHGRIHAAIVNAGGVASEIVETITDHWRRDIDLNLTGAAFTAEAVRPLMEQSGGGAILFIGSVNGLQYFGHPAYSAAKAGLIAHTRSLACLLGPKNIRVNLIAPGTVRTPAWEARAERRPEIWDQVAKWYPLGRVCAPDDIAAAALFLCSQGAQMITGVTLPVDGGLTAGNAVFAAEIS